MRKLTELDKAALAVLWFVVALAVLVIVLPPDPSR